MSFKKTCEIYIDIRPPELLIDLEIVRIHEIYNKMMMQLGKVGLLIINHW